MCILSVQSVSSVPKKEDLSLMPHAGRYSEGSGDSPYYQSAAFGKVIAYMGLNPRHCNLREQNGKRSMVVKNVENVETAVSILQEIVSMEG